MFQTPKFNGINLNALTWIFFIYDSFLNHKIYDRLLARMETRIIDTEQNGRIS